MKRLLLPLAAAAVCAVAMPATSPARSTCVNLKMSKSTKSGIRAAHKKVDPDAIGPKRGSIYYGRCGNTFYALASFKNPRTGYDDQPEGFRSRGTTAPWRDIGDNGCAKMPKRLLAIWSYDCPF